MENLSADQMIEQSILIGKRNALMHEILQTNARLNTVRSVQAPNNPSKPVTPKAPVTIEEQPDSKPKSKVTTKKVKPKAPKPVEVPERARKTETKVEESVDDAEVSNSLRTVKGVHLDVYDYFSIDPDEINDFILSKLTDIYSWITKSKTFKHGMKKLNEVDLKLGKSDMGDTKVINIYNWLRISGKIK